MPLGAFAIPLAVSVSEGIEPLFFTESTYPFLSIACAIASLKFLFLKSGYCFSFIFTKNVPVVNTKFNPLLSLYLFT
ncbi:Uncharacterised protein [Staphylococcus aureus]|nr:Uncharacterised protein [Staphylococcus aureus]